MQDAASKSGPLLFSYTYEQLGEIVRDANRYRWLRENAYAHADDGLPHCVTHEINGWGKWVDRLTEGNRLDALIDAQLGLSAEAADQDVA